MPALLERGRHGPELLVLDPEGLLELRDELHQLLLALTRRLQPILRLGEIGRDDGELQTVASRFGFASHLGVKDGRRDGLHAKGGFEDAHPSQARFVRRRGEEQRVGVAGHLQLEDVLEARV